MKIIDCFTFFNELDLLEFRLKLLDSSVSHFVIAESDHTHAGGTKPFHFELHRDRFAPWLHKILYLPVKQNIEGLTFDKNETAYNPGSASWQLENGQRNALSAANTLANDEDIVLLSDLDEIPDPNLLKGLRSLEAPRSLSLLFHYYYMNCQHTGNDRWWNGCIVSTGSQFRNTTPQELRDKRNDFKVIRQAGWHFSFLGGIEKIRQKLVSFAHTEFSKDEFLDEKHLSEAVMQGQDILKREKVTLRYMPLSYYPNSLQKIMKEYPAFIHAKKSNPFTDLYNITRRILKGKF